MAVGLVIAAVAVIPVAVPLAWGLMAHFECGQSATVATVELWSPEVLVNAPYGGFGNATGSILPRSSTNTTVANGSAAGVFELAEWTIGRSVRVLTAGPGANPICTGYLATPRFEGNYMGASMFAPRNATSNVGQGTSFSYYGHDSARFHNGYVEQDLSVNTCGGGGVILGVTASRMAIDIPFTLDGSNHTASATVSGAFNYTYSLPGHFGVYSIDDLNRGANAPGGGWAFSYTPCP